jgi:hypothetical protein
MTAGLRQQWQRLVEQVRDNPRLQGGLLLIAGLVAGWLFLVLGDLRQDGLRRLDQARQEYFRVRQLAGERDWPQRADAAVKLADALSAEIPDVASAGLAQAAFQDWLKDIVDDQGVPVRIDLQAPVRLEPPAQDIVRITATLSGGMDPRQAWRMIHRIESGSALATIPDITVRSDGPNQTFSITVQGFFRLPGVPQEAVR